MKLGNELDLLAYWNFEEGQDTTAYDQTTNGNNGTLVNGPTWSNNTPTQSCVLTNANGCDSTATLNLTIDICGCIDSLALNYNPLANTDDGSCIYCDISFNTPIYQANSLNTACDGYIIVSATSSYLPITYTWSNGVSGANNLNLCTGLYIVTAIDGNGCSVTDTFMIGQFIYGCTNSSAYNYDLNANIDDGSCCLIAGCTDSLAFNYNVTACYDDGSCIPVVLGCTDSLAFNYNPNANTDDGFCYTCNVSFITPVSQAPSSGNCNGLIIVNATSSNSSYINYTWNTGATGNHLTSLCAGIYVVTATDSLYCSATDTIYLGTIIYGCTDSTQFNYNSSANVDDGSCIAVVLGCTDSLAINYDPLVNTNNGSCLYCDLTNTLYVTQNTSINCNGFIIANSSTSYGPISYLWNTGSTYNNITLQR